MNRDHRLTNLELIARGLRWQSAGPEVRRFARVDGGPAYLDRLAAWERQQREPRERNDDDDVATN